MLTVSSSVSGSLVGLMNGRVGLIPDFFSPAGGGSGTFVRFLFEVLPWCWCWSSFFAYKNG